MTATMPTEKPAASKQTYETPAEFIDAVRSRFGLITWDLAAVSATSKAERVAAYYGPGSSAGEDALVQDWTVHRGTCWCNPPYKDISPWSAKAALSLAAVRADAARKHRHDWRLLLLTPASIGTRWFRQHVFGQALVLALSPRIQFVGTSGTDLRDYMLSVYGERPGFDCWRWSE